MKTKVQECQKILIGQFYLNKIKKEKKEKSFIWLVILSELENFLQNEYLFADLFKEEAFGNAYDSLTKTLDKLSQEQGEQILIEEKSLGKYIDSKQKFITLIGNYIYSEF